MFVTPLENTSVHPNHLTTVTLIPGQAAVWTFAFTIGLAGELARMTGKTSSFMPWRT